MNALSASDILTKEEVRAVLDYCIKKRRHKNIRQNEVIFRLTVCCGLRVTELCKLTLGDFFLEGSKPAIRVQKKNVKGKWRMRTVPLWWDTGNLSVLTEWIAHRRSCGATNKSPVVCVLGVGLDGRPLDRREARKRWKSLVGKSLGRGRGKQLSIHCGRHTFASIALEVGRSLVEVQTALGHSSIAMTARYCHLIERNNVPNLYS